ncbi:hypothetical protein ACW4TU_03940 [Streptomyces sp. QTS52]
MAFTRAVAGLAALGTPAFSLGHTRLMFGTQFGLLPAAAVVGLIRIPRLPKALQPEPPAASTMRRRPAQPSPDPNYFARRFRTHFGTPAFGAASPLITRLPLDVPVMQPPSDNPLVKIQDRGLTYAHVTYTFKYHAVSNVPWREPVGTALRLQAPRPHPWYSAKRTHRDPHLLQ